MFVFNESAATETRVTVRNPIPGSWICRASISVISARIWSPTRSGREDMGNATGKRSLADGAARGPSTICQRPHGRSGRLAGCRHAFGDEHFDDVAHLEVVVLVEADAALEPGLDFRDVVLEAAERSNLALVDDDVVAHQAGLGVARPLDRAVGDHAAR